MRTVSGIAASRGLAIGPAFRLRTAELRVERTTVKDRSAEKVRFLTALAEAAAQLADVRTRAAAETGADTAAIFEAQSLMIDDPELLESVQRDIDEMEVYLEDAGLDILDIWMERRIRRVPVEEYLTRMRVVASHLNAGYTPEQLADLHEKVTAATTKAAGPRGFEYTFTKLYAIARKPG